jgi:hypothetical protein
MQNKCNIAQQRQKPPPSLLQTLAVINKNKKIMKFYDLNTELTFGKYRGKTIKEILSIRASYLNWCSINLDHFYLSDEVIKEMKEVKPNFSMSNEAVQKLTEKYTLWENEQTQNNLDDQDYVEDDRPTYTQYRDSYAQDVEGWSDQAINDAFGGEADAYWNID